MKNESKKEQGLMILNRNNFSLYTPSLKGFVTFTFPEAIVKNIEILKQEELERQIKLFIENSGVSPAEITIVLSSSIIFEKEISGGVEEKVLRQRFLDSLPFESVYKSVIPKDQKPYIAVVNKPFVDGVMLSFTNLGFTIPRIIPYVFLERNAINTIDTNTAPEIIKKSENMKIYNMLDYAQVTAPQAGNDSFSQKEKEGKTKIRILIGVLSLFIIFLLIIIFWRTFS